MSKKQITNDERLIVALDFPEPQAALTFVQQLGDSVRFYKVGLELFLSDAGPGLIDRLLSQQKKVFLDLKFFDIPQTVGRAVARVKDLGVTFVSVHGNDNMLQAAVDNKGEQLKVLAVTVLTSMDRADLKDLGYPAAVDVQQLVLSRAKRAFACGCDGVVASGLETKPLRREVGEELVVVAPGIRPLDNDDDQKRTVNVEQAFANGADYIVVGRPIRQADNPAAAAAAIQETIVASFSA